MKDKTKTNEIELIGDGRFDENGLTENPTEEELERHYGWMEWMTSEQKEAHIKELFNQTKDSKEEV